jgi:hypothetical protein
VILMPRVRTISKRKIVENAIYRQKTAENELLTSGAASLLPEPKRALLLVSKGLTGYPDTKDEQSRIERAVEIRGAS